MLEEVLDLLVAPNIRITNTEEDDCTTLGHGQIFSQAFSTFADFVGSIIIVIEWHIVADTRLVIGRPING